MKRIVGMKNLIGLALLAGAGLVQAQGQNIPGAPPSAAKKELAQRLLTIQQPALESMARDLVERPARQMLGAADEVLQTRVPPEKRQAATQQIQDLMRTYVADANSVAKERASKVGQTSLGPLFEEKFTEDELRQLLTALESPAYKKFQQSLPELTSVYGQALVKDLEPTFEPKLKALEQSVGAALGVTGPGASAPKPGPAKAAKPPAQPASKPAKK